MSQLFGPRQNNENTKKQGGSVLTSKLCPACSKPMKSHSMNEILNCALNHINSVRVSDQ